MRPLVRTELEAVINALGRVYVDGRNEGNWHVLTFNLINDSHIRGRVVSLEDEGIFVGLEPTRELVTVAWDSVQSLLIEAD